MLLPEILVASGNPGKLQEITQLLSEVKAKAVSPVGFNIEEPEENGSDFASNSLIKAKYYGQKAGMIALADDSGLCIDLLDGAPGIYSARWAINPENGKKDFNIAFTRIENELRKRNIDKNQPIKAHFICNLTIFNPKNNLHHSFEGRIDGNLTFPAKGNNGFGYDPIFISEIFTNKTFGEISPQEKDAISHRAIAFTKFKEFLNSPQLLDFLDTVS